MKHQENCFVLEIDNNVPEADQPKPNFSPKSISAGAEPLGGLTNINAREGMTKVRVETHS